MTHLKKKIKSENKDTGRATFENLALNLKRMLKNIYYVDIKSPEPVFVFF